MRKVLVALLACVGMALLAAPAPADVVLDDFTTTTFFNPPPINVGVNLHPVGTGPVTVADPGTNILGGTRSVTFGAVTGVAGHNVSGFITGNLFNYASTMSADSRLTLGYSAAPAFPLDITGFSGVKISIMSFDFAFGNSLPITVTITDTANVTDEASATLNAPGDFVLDFPFASFTGGTLGAADQTQIKSITFDFAANVGHDFAVGPILLQQVIPEPLSLLVWTTVGLVGCAFGWRFRRRPA